MNITQLRAIELLQQHSQVALLYLQGLALRVIAMLQGPVQKQLTPQYDIWKVAAANRAITRLVPSDDEMEGPLGPRRRVKARPPGRRGGGRVAPGDFPAA